MAPIDIYRVPRHSVDVEALTQELAGYLEIIGEDTALSFDPARRDKLFAELYKQPGIKPGAAPVHFVQPDGNPDDHLIPANAAIAELTPPKSFEDRVHRLHIAWPALMTVNQFKVDYALLDLPDLEWKVTRHPGVSPT